MTSFKVAALGFMDMLTRGFDTAVPLYFLSLERKRKYCLFMSNLVDLVPCWFGFEVFKHAFGELKD